MSFWNKRPARSASAGGGPSGAQPEVPSPAEAVTESSALLSGDAREDSRSLGVLLDTIARVSASRDLLIDDKTGKQVVRVARAQDRDGEAKSIGRDSQYSTSVVKRVVDRQEPIRTSVQKDSEELDLGNSVFDLKLRAVMCVPMTGRSGEGAPGTSAEAPVGGALPKGALYVDSRAATRDFRPEDLALFHALAQHIAIALENAQLNLHSIERARLERSLEIAAEIQSGLMPKAPPKQEGFDLFGWYRSAEHASGDFYDFVKTRGGGTAAVVGDVTGHGVGPALITATAQASLRSYARVLGDPGSVVTMLNSDLSERMDDGMFLTLFVAALGSEGELQLLNAGHTPPLVWRAASRTIESVGADGPALGLMDDMEYEVGTPIQLETGDLLLAFTDGLVEARHPDLPDRLFDERGVRAVLSDQGFKGASARETVEAVAAAALEFSGNAREDDITILAIRKV
ncbi:MAG: PP2C family protein-serine/threonine phosphatase [Planctomycetota bacterium]